LPLHDEMKLQYSNSLKTECTLHLSDNGSIWLQQ
jgi:hypothetical protein